MRHLCVVTATSVLASCCVEDDFTDTRPTASGLDILHVLSSDHFSHASLPGVKENGVGILPIGTRTVGDAGCARHDRVPTRLPSG